MTPTPRTPTPGEPACDRDESGRCTILGGGSGHGLFWVPANMTGRRPWGWRDARVTALDGLTLEVVYDEPDVRVAVWHHVDLSSVLSVGSRVRFHEEMSVLDTPIGWLSARLLSGGAGAVPAPAGTDPALRSFDVPLTDLTTGVARLIDHDDHDPT